MADAGNIVTDKQVLNFVEGMEAVTEDSKEEILIKAAEATVERYCGKDFSKTSHVDEPYDVNREQVIDKIVVKASNIIRLDDYPVDLTEDFTLKYVTSRDATTGDPVNPTTIVRNAYDVEAESGIVTLYKDIVSQQVVFPSFPLSNSVISFPNGVSRILATYTSGVVVTSIPYDLKMGVLMLIARLWKMTKVGEWTVKNVASQFGVTTQFRVELTPEEMFFLRKFKKPQLV